MSTLPFFQVDVFGLHPLAGNPLAVVLDADGLATAQMQALARWTNLSETAFLLRPTLPEADYRVRIFTPRAELPFAGHPSIGAAFVARWSGRVAAHKPRLLQECAAGLLPLRLEAAAGAERLLVRSPQAGLRRLARATAMKVNLALGLADDSPVFHVDVGARWLVAPALSARRVLSLRPDLAALKLLSRRLDGIGVNVYGWQPEHSADLLEVRSFAPLDGIEEDPVCGSGNAAVAAVLLRLQELDGNRQYSVRQGRSCGRDGRVHVAVDPATGSIEIGGAASPVIEGAIRLP